MDTSVTPVGLAASVPIGGHTGEESTKPKKPVTRYTPHELQGVIEELNKSFRSMNSKVSFSYDQASRQVIIQVTDGNTNAVIRQIPSEDMLRVSANIKALIGVLLDKAF